MNTIEQKLSKEFSRDGIKISFASEEFNIHETGENFFSTKKDVQFYIYEEEMGLESISAFYKKCKLTFAELVAICYERGELGSKIPTDVICVSGARSSNERNEDGTSNGVIYHLTKKQIDEITEEWERNSPLNNLTEEDWDEMNSQEQK